jgi:transposase-like protein
VVRTRNSLDSTEAERHHIRDLYPQGIRIVDIMRRTKRSEALVQRTVRGLTRPRLHRRTARRSPGATLRIVQRVVKEGRSMHAVARRFGLTPTMVCHIVRVAQGLKRPNKRRPAGKLGGKATQTSVVQPPPSRNANGHQQLTRAKRTRRDGEIVRRVEAGMSIAAVARRYSLTPPMVRWLLRRRSRGSPSRAR